MRALLAFLWGAGLVSGGWAWWTDRRYKSAMEEIESEIMAGRNAIACRNLNKLLSWKADPSGRILYLLGSCELAQGRNQPADEAWERVVPGSAFYERAIRGRVYLFHESGQLAAAERLVSAAALDRRNDPTALRVLLVPIYGELGRIDEAERLIEERWEHLNALGEGALEPAVKLLLQHIGLTLPGTPVETIRASCDQAARLAPEDDRVWLGRANVAILTGAYDEAGRWLDACQQRRPDDVPVWRARLRWGIATNRIDVVEEAVTHLPATESTPAHLHRVNAWLASRRGDAATERRELERLVAADPADLTAGDRLAQLAERDRQPARVAELLRRKAEIGRLLARYTELYERKQPLRDAVRMARLAEQLGRRFEARAFLTLAISQEPGRTNLRQDLRRLSPRAATALLGLTCVAGGAFWQIRPNGIPGGKRQAGGPLRRDGERVETGAALVHRIVESARPPTGRHRGQEVKTSAGGPATSHGWRDPRSRPALSLRRWRPIARDEAGPRHSLVAVG
jgi:tetratricopeptide (TPR) repeat protein